VAAEYRRRAPDDQAASRERPHQLDGVPGRGGEIVEDDDAPRTGQHRATLLAAELHRPVASIQREDHPVQEVVDRLAGSDPKIHPGYPEVRPGNCGQMPQQGGLADPAAAVELHRYPGFQRRDGVGHLAVPTHRDRLRRQRLRSAAQEPIGRRPKAQPFDLPAVIGELHSEVPTQHTAHTLPSARHHRVGRTGGDCPQPANHEWWVVEPGRKRLS